MTKSTIKPSDILPDGVDSIIIDGKAVRKGTVAAFLANITIYENSNSTAEQREDAYNALVELAPDVNRIGLSKYVVFKNDAVEAILCEARLR